MDEQNIAKRTLVSMMLMSGLSNFLTYALPQLYVSVRGIQNLKKKYQAKWALVTGSSSGIGAAVTEKLAQQGVNVVLVALDDKVLSDFVASIRTKYPKIEFRVVATNLGKFPAQGADDYMVAIRKATEDIDINIVVNNAGYVYLQPLHAADLDRQLNNIECMVLSYVKITDHFYKLMVARKRKGAIFFTSSQGAFFPSPLSTVYGGGKAFVASYARDLACEAKSFGIDVLVTHPGYVRSNFTRDLPKLNLWAQLDKIGQTPMQLADNMFRSIGRVTVLDSGAFSWGSRLVTKVLDTNFLVGLLKKTSFLNSDYRKMMSAKPMLPQARL
eukprot:TRINITY_DN7071_c0_g1_i1.p1 TRINITY_DN7071_c0_g1~~TRINITY_DN7071_c0_g1_i1.p1  ORF type:complete len:328 (+),score=70.10 TRINITY_DN7071_c0_g1_i1:83-1066(+)